MIAFPINVARKNFQNGTPNCPHIMPARSKRGFGTYSKRRNKKAISQVEKLHIIEN